MPVCLPPPHTHPCRYGLAIGYYCAWLVRLLMAATSPISWPIGKLLDFLLGAEHRALFRWVGGRLQQQQLFFRLGAGLAMGGRSSAGRQWSAGIPNLYGESILWVWVCGGGMANACQRV